jgi:hypothetical protein
MAQAVQIVGALLILLGFVLAQFRVIDQHSHPYLWLNLVGAAVLTVLAWHERQWGFFILEAVWTVVTAWSLFRRLRPAAA